MTNEIWTLVLAGGAGRRLATVTGGIPKQFWRPRGGESLLEFTLRRFAPFSAAAHTVVVVDESHRPHVSAALAPSRVPIVFQPCDRGTGTGLLLGLTPVLATSPDALVLVTAADHGISDLDTFHEGLRQAIESLHLTAGIVLFGVEATDANTDYGWINVTSDGTRGCTHGVESFVEKPAASVARRLLSMGAVWNTMILLARARDLRALAVERHPTHVRAFDRIVETPPAQREQYLAETYQHLPPLDLSRDLLGRARNLAAYIWPASVGWSDLGTPDRLATWRSSAASSKRSSSAA